MTAAEFTRLVEQPSLLRDANVAELRELVQRYPYSASVHLLLLKKYQLDKHPDFDARLALTAAYANDRKALYRLLYDDAKFKSTEGTETVSEEQRVGTEIMLGNESGAFADYTPKNQVAEVENYEPVDFVRSGWAEGLRSMEIEKENEQANEKAESLSIELQEQFALANEKAGGGAEINHDFDNLDEDNDDELLEENHDVELESTKALEDAIEQTVEENEYREFATLSAANAEVTHRFDGLDEENENELVDEHLDAEVESNKILEDAFAQAVAEPNYKELASEVKQNGTTDSSALNDYSDSMLAEEKAEAVEESNSKTENDLANRFEPSESLAQLLSDDEENETEEFVGNALTEEIKTNQNNFTDDKSSLHQGVENISEADAAMQELQEEATLPTSLNEHEINPEEISTVENGTQDATPDLTPRHEINVPIAEEDIVGTKHRDIPIEAAAPYREAESKTQSKETVSHQAVDKQGNRSFTEWLRLLQNPDQKSVVDSQKPEVVEQKKKPEASGAKVKPTETTESQADTLYDREWQARSLEMQSWTSGLPDELKVIDEFVSQHSSHQPVSKPESTVAELAQRSLETREEFVTETMAKVYAAQGKFKKAAEVTEKLMLKYPAKSRYFADLLEEYKKKITPQ